MQARHQAAVVRASLQPLSYSLGALSGCAGAIR